MDSVKQEVEGHCLGVVGKPVILRVEEVSVENIFKNGPVTVTQDKVY